MSAAKWYVLHVYSGFENKVADAIRDKAQKQGLEEYIEEILVPKEEVVEVRRGQRVNTQRNVFPGYVLAKMQLNDQLWHVVKNTDKVSGFLGGGGNKPMPISEREAQQLITQLKEGTAARPAVMFDIGEDVKVTDGPFASFNGVVEEIDEDKQRLKVSVSIFGRATPVELEFGQVEKV